ncbi:MAG: phosphoribosylformylglycinamidine synthase subunit PurQ [Bacteroidetes bacterium]|nr:phosphoribosylformylglycinamidine synthase subunit PurQ [Bacteroidota bacterium]
MKFGVVVFPGSNCDDDIIYVLESVLDQEVIPLWHKSEELTEFEIDDWIILPGGFAHGDYLRAGAIARFSPIMNEVIEFANRGGNLMGICNGFQILCEAGLLPGVLLPNIGQNFICKNIFIKSETSNSKLTKKINSTKPLKIPIAHAEGRYFAKDEDLVIMKDNDMVLFRYCNDIGNVNKASNPNGSVDNIAGICNIQRNVFGLMPHPERAAEEALGNKDGELLFKSIISATKEEYVI